jgi:hypothetical protein
VASIEKLLESANRHLDQAQRRIEEQVIAIERLREKQLDTAGAERLLATYLDVMDTLVLHRDRIAEEFRALQSGTLSGERAQEQH